MMSEDSLGPHVLWEMCPFILYPRNLVEHGEYHTAGLLTCV